MKKQYTTPDITVELLSTDSRIMLTGSDGNGTIISDGGGTLPSGNPIDAKNSFGSWEEDPDDTEY